MNNVFILTALGVNCVILSKMFNAEKSELGILADDKFTIVLGFFITTLYLGIQLIKALETIYRQLSQTIVP